MCKFIGDSAKLVRVKAPCFEWMNTINNVLARECSEVRAVALDDCIKVVFVCDVKPLVTCAQ